MIEGHTPRSCRGLMDPMTQITTGIANHWLFARVYQGRCARILRRFLGLVHSGGWRFALTKASRKIGSRGRLWIEPVLVRWPFSAWIGHRRYSQLDPYAVWLSFNRATPARRERIQAALDGLRYKPLFSVLLPVFNTPPDLLRQVIASMLAQTYGQWELIVVDDASTLRDHHAELDVLGGRDPRIKVSRRTQNGNISIATNAAAELAGATTWFFWTTTISFIPMQSPTSQSASMPRLSQI